MPTAGGGLWLGPQLGDQLALGFGTALAKVMLGVVLGPLLEQPFRHAMAIAGGDPTVFESRR